jgi:hypothetical protein
MFPPWYQHFRPSMNRYDQCPCGFDGSATLHWIACAVCMPKRRTTDEQHKQRERLIERAWSWANLAQGSTQRLRSSFPNLVTISQKFAVCKLNSQSPQMSWHGPFIVQESGLLQRSSCCAPLPVAKIDRTVWASEGRSCAVWVRVN